MIAGLISIGCIAFLCWLFYRLGKNQARIEELERQTRRLEREVDRRADEIDLLANYSHRHTPPEGITP